jgi:RNA polymerase sigma-70 factor (ECF subfamily)
MGPRVAAGRTVEVRFVPLRGPSPPVILRLTVGLRMVPGGEGRAVDRDLVLRAQRGDEAAFATLLQRYGDRLHATAHHILRDADLAGDAVQLAMIEIWRKLPQLRDPDAFLGWAYRIVVRAALAETKARSSWRIRTEPIHEEGPSISYDDRLDDRDELERGFARLSPEHRAVLVLKHYAGLSNTEIARSMDIPEGTVRSRLFHAVQSLRSAIEADRRTHRETSR